MTPDEFVALLRSTGVDENAASDRSLFQNTPASEATDPYWKPASSLFAGLEPEQQEVSFESLRQVTVDATSSILGVLDGSSWFGGKRGHFDLTRNGGPKLNGDLQDLFLEAEETAARSSRQT